MNTKQIITVVLGVASVAVLIPPALVVSLPVVGDLFGVYTVGVGSNVWSALIVMACLGGAGLVGAMWAIRSSS